MAANLEGPIRPYGDTPDDGMVQLSFTLPLRHDARAEAAALSLAEKMGLRRPLLVHAAGVGAGFSFFVVYGQSLHAVDLTELVVEQPEYQLLSAPEVNEAIRRSLGRPAVVIGACIGTDAHTVGIDAILNLKGFAGEKGLEYYQQLRVVNLGSQVSVNDLVARTEAESADAVLVSQAVTQRDAHVVNVRELSAGMTASFGPRRPLLVVGGPRFGSHTAADLGVDRVFGRGTGPAEVASYLAYTLARQHDAAVSPARLDEQRV